LCVYLELTEAGVATSFAEQVGFHRVKAYLERMLTEKYYASVPPTLHMLDNICKESERVRRRPLASPLTSNKTGKPC
jgi:hypothetical protein